MPAVDPARLKSQLADLTALIDHPETASRACLEFFSDHMDRVRRSSAGGTGQLSRSFGVPEPVLRELIRAFVPAARRHPVQAPALAELLWRSDYREGRLVAAALTGTRSDAGVPDWVESRAGEVLDPVVRHSLAKESLHGWRSAHPNAFLDKLQVWLAAGRGPVTDLALIGLADAAGDAAVGYQPRLLSMLEPCLLDPTPGRRRFLLDAVRALARVAPSETAQWLADALRGNADPSELVLVIQKTMGAFPARQRGFLRATLSG